MRGMLSKLRLTVGDLKLMNGSPKLVTCRTEDAISLVSRHNVYARFVKSFPNGAWRGLRWHEICALPGFKRGIVRCCVGVLGLVALQASDPEPAGFRSHVGRVRKRVSLRVRADRSTIGVE
jgi:hypothetical protein